VLDLIVLSACPSRTDTFPSIYSREMLRDPRSAHPGYEQQLHLETVSEWGEGYVDYRGLLELAIAVQHAKSPAVAVDAFAEHVEKETKRSSAFFRKELASVVRRFHELGGRMSPELWHLRDELGSAFPLQRKYNESRDNMDDSRHSHSPSTAGSRVYSLSSPKLPSQRQIAGVRELRTIAGKLGRFQEIQAKTLRHAIDGLRIAAPAESVVVEKNAKRLFSQSDLSQLRPTLRVLQDDIAAFLETAGDDQKAKSAELANNIALVSWIIKWHFVLLAAVIFVVLLVVPLLEHDVAAHRCAAIIACVATLWITEAIPFFATALLIPLLAVPLKVLPGMSHRETGTQLLGAMFNHTQILVLGGLCLGKAIAKHQLECQIARFLLRPVAGRPWLYLLVLMFSSAALCAVISNVAAPVLITSIVQPSLWELDPTSDAPQAILLAVAFACNFGGMLTPIASPQNAVAQQALAGSDISFGSWLAAALPIVVIGILTAWAVVILIWRPFADLTHIPIPHAKTLFHADADEPERDSLYVQEYSTSGHDPDDVASRASTTTLIPMQDAGVAQQRRWLKIEVGLIAVILAITVILWCVPEDSLLGDTGVVALIPIVVFFGTGVLKKNDFNNLSWHLIFLLSGGNMLGMMSQQSQLLQIVIDGLQPFLETHETYQVVAVLIVCVALITTFVSHTVAALLLMPVIVQVSRTNSALPSSETLVFLSVIMCSGSMAFPITSFPNVNSLLTEAHDGKPYLLARHFLFPGLCLSAVVLAQLTTYMVVYTDALFPRK
jgi:phosphate transporter